MLGLILGLDLTFSACFGVDAKFLHFLLHVA